MAQRLREGANRTSTLKSTTFGTAANSARQQFLWLWSRESLLRLALSFVLAVALWLYISGKQDPNLAQDFPQPLPIETTNVANGLSVSTNVSFVRVRYRVDSPGAIVTAANFHAQVNLSGVNPGPPRYATVQVLPDPGIHVVQIFPARVLVTVDRIESRAIRVRPTVLVQAPPGYSSGPIRMTPDRLTILGPHALVSSVTAATVDIDLRRVTSSIDTSFRPVLRDSQGAPVEGNGRIELDPPQVQVHIPITPLSSLKTLPILVPLQGQVKAGYHVIALVTRPTELVARGSPSILGKINSVWTTPVIVNGRQRSFTVRAGLQIRQSVTSATKQVSVRVDIAPIGVNK